jgi:23S rRNA (adenine2030-N6)-methyltransferase
MLSYQHGYHAGGPADAHKHSVLAALLSLLRVKPRPISYLESHAGRGYYDLSDAMAAKTGEAARGLGLLRPFDHPYWTAIEAARAALGPAAYPGSPGVAQALLRTGDRITLMELHPAEHAALGRAMAGRGGPAVAIHRRDGLEGLRALTPPDPLRGLALIDPSYELKSEYDEVAMAALEVWSRWPQGVLVIWYPLLNDPRHESLTGPVEAVARSAGPDALLRDEVTFAERPARGMVGSGLLILNPPYGAREALATAHRVCAGALAPAARAA